MWACKPTTYGTPSFHVTFEIFICNISQNYDFYLQVLELKRAAQIS